MNPALQAVLDHLQAKTAKTLDANGDGKVDAADLQLVIAVAQAGATKQTDSLAAKYGTLAVFGAGVACTILAAIAARLLHVL